MTVLGGQTFDDRLKRYYGGWHKSVKNEFLKLKHSDEHFLRQYGGTNMQEFFAVCIEHFFEVPKAMKTELPRLYNSLCVLLNQDPLHTTTDYRISPGLKRKFPELITSRAKSHDITWHWSLTLMLIGFFAGVFTLLFWEMFFFITTASKIALWSGTALIVGIAHYPSVVRNNIMGMPVYVVYTLIGPTPVFIAGMLLVNSLIPFDKEQTVRLPQIDYEDLSRGRGTVVTYFYESPEGVFHKHVEEVRGYYGSDLKDSDMYMNINRGIFGYRVKGSRNIRRLDGGWVY